MKGIYVQKGDNLDYKNPTEAEIEAGSVIKFGNMCAVAAATIPPGEVGAIATVGVWTLPKDSSEVTAGALVYYDDSADKATTTKKDNVLGIAAADAKTDAAAVTVKLNVGFAPAAGE